MKKFWPVPVTILAGLLVLLVVVRDLSLPGLSEKRQQAVASLEKKIEVIGKKPDPPSAPASKSPTPVSGSQTAMEKWNAVHDKVDDFYSKFIPRPSDCPILDKLYNSMYRLDCHTYLLDSHTPSNEELECLMVILGKCEELTDTIYSLCSNPETVLALRMPEKGPSYSEEIGLCDGIMRSLNLLALRAFLNAVSGDASLAKREILAVANQDNGPLVLWHGKTIDVAVIETISALLRQEPSDIPGAEELFGILKRIHPPEFYRNDMAFCARESVRDLTDWEQDIQDAPFTLKMAWWGYTSICRPLYEYDVRKYVDGVNELLDVVDLPYYQAVPTFRKVTRDLAQPAIPRPPYDMLRPFIWRLNVQAEWETAEDLMRIDIALHKYRVAKGDFPTALSDLQELLGGMVPVEPLSGGPYTYSREDNDFTLSCRIPVFDWGTEFNRSEPFTW